MHALSKGKVPYNFQSRWFQPKSKIRAVLSLQTQIRKLTREYLNGLSLLGTEIITLSPHIHPKNVSEDCDLKRDHMKQICKTYVQ